jgi:RNA polymerase sigma factor (sigma-70 family)
VSTTMTNPSRSGTVLPLHRASRSSAAHHPAGLASGATAAPSPARCPSGPSDSDLAAAVRAGKLAAYDTLYRRHLASAHSLARQLNRSHADADDLVSEAFAAVLDALRRGAGPDGYFRAYLLTTLRHIAYARTRRDRRLELTADVETTAFGSASSAAIDAITDPFRDTTIAQLERTLAAEAFGRLPERWQTVLWHTEINGAKPADIAPLFGLSPNGTAALAMRAREGLRLAYLRAFMAKPHTSSPACAATTGKLGGWIRGRLSKRDILMTHQHLDECSACRATVDQLRLELPA